MPRHVNLRASLVVDVGTLPQQVVNISRYRLLIADDGGGAKNDGVAWDDLNEPVIAIGDLGQRRRWFTLAAGADDDELTWWDAHNVFYRHQCTYRHAQVTQLDCHLCIIDHRATYQRNF